MVALDAYQPSHVLTVSFEGKCARAMHEYSIWYSFSPVHFPSTSLTLAIMAIQTAIIDGLDFNRLSRDERIQWDPVIDAPAEAARRFSGLELQCSQHLAAGGFVVY
jgi:hypothetical protein